MTNQTRNELTTNHRAPRGANALLLSLALASAIPATAAPFTSATKYTVGHSATSLTVGDLNRDGTLDLITTSDSGSGLAVLFGRAGGTFSAALSLSTGSGPVWAAVADLNLDGKPDIVVANRLDGSVSVLFGDGAGGFAAPSALSVGSGGSVPSWVGVADLNGDGQPDLVLAADSSVAVLFGAGGGNFTSAQLMPVAAGLRRGVLADLNGDGRLDIAVTNSTQNNIAVLFGDGEGGFASIASLSTGRGPTGILAIDLDGDGRMDLVTANTTDDTVAVLRGTGAGGFAPPAVYPANAGPTDVVAGDFDGDCVMDVAVANQGNGGHISVLPGNGAGGFRAPVAYNSGPGPIGLTAADFNLDLKTDIAFVTTHQSSAWVSFNVSPAACRSVRILRSEDPTSVSTAPVLSTVAAAPFDDAAGTLGDGRTYFYLVDNFGRSSLLLSVGADRARDSVRLGFDDGNPVSAQVDIAQSVVSVDSSTIPADGVTTATVTIVPQDASGTLLGSGLTLSVDAASLLPGVAGPIQDMGNGTYRLGITSSSAGTGVVAVNVEGLDLAARPNVSFATP